MHKLSLLQWIQSRKGPRTAQLSRGYQSEGAPPSLAPRLRSLARGAISKTRLPQLRTSRQSPRARATRRTSVTQPRAYRQPCGEVKLSNVVHTHELFFSGFSYYCNFILVNLC